MAAYQLFQLPKQLNISSSFTLSAGAKAYFYATTTTTPQNTYTTSALNVAHPNPVVADAAGVLPAIYLDPSLQYKLTLNTSADVLIYTVDPVNDQLFSQSIFNIYQAASDPFKRTTVEVSAGVTPSNYAIPSHDAVGVVMPARYGLSTAASAATNTAALDSAEAVIAQLGGGVAKVGPGRFVITNFTCSTNSMVIEGDGETATLWDYATPTGDGVAMTFSKGASSIVRSGIRRCGFISASSSTKTGVVFNDGRQSIFEHIAFNSGNWSGTDSIGLRTYGRDFYRFRDCDIECARPWIVSVNPNSGDLHVDMTAVRDTQTASTATTGKNIELETGVEPTNFSLESVDMAGGKYGFYYVDTTSNLAPYHLSFINCRYEQNADAAGFSYYIETNATLQNAYWQQCHFDPACGGIHLRNAQKVSLKDCTFPGGAGITNLDITFISTTVLTLENTLVQQASTATLTSAVLVWGDELTTTISAIPCNALYKYDQAAIVSQKPALGYNSERTWAYQGTLANNGTINTPVTQAAYTVAKITVGAYAATGPIHSGGSAIWTKDGTMTKIGGSANFVVTNVGANIRVLDGGSGLVVINALGQSAVIVIDIVFI